ncbi:MAG: putative Ig domain-containing protein, partial [Mucilaginibacter sp.]
NNTLTYSLSGELPPGLNFDAMSKTISGKPLKTGSYKIDVTATDTAGAKASCGLQINVGA